MAGQNWVRVEVQVKPRASHNRVEGFKEGVLQVRLTSPPVDGAANSSLVKLVSKSLGIARGKVRIVSGERSRKKVIEIEGVTEEEIKEAF